jgi:5-methylthioadenosine/S-adenosylhomocysteine deaminase
MLVLPGLINGHTHAHIGAIGRGDDDWDPAEHGGRLRFDVSGRRAVLAEQLLSDDEFEAVVTLGVIEHALGGATTIVEQSLAAPEALLRAVERLGLRADVSVMVPTYAELLDAREHDTHPHHLLRDTELRQIAEVDRLHDRWHDQADGRIRVRYGLHGPDTAAPETLDAVAEGMSRLDVGLHIHLNQSPLEDGIVRRATGQSPAEYLHHHGVLGERTIVAHMTAASDSDLALVASCGATIASCPFVYAQGGSRTTWARFRDEGVNVVLGTDNYMHDLLEVMKTGALLGKVASGSGTSIRATDAIDAVTRNGARALGRPDLGGIAPGMRADLTILDLSGPLVGPAREPLKSAVYYANASNVAWTLVDGRVVVERGRVVTVDHERVLRDGAAAIQRVWSEAEARGWV